MQPIKEWVNQVPLRIKTDLVETLAGLSRFHGITDETLIRIARRRTGVQVADRWGAIRMLLSNPCPIPVVGGRQKPRSRISGLATPLKLSLIQGRRISR
jgi:hypothetical protein